MSTKRTKRIADQIQEEVSGLLLRGIKDPRIGFVTITGVDVTPDLGHAVVFFCTTDPEEQREQSREGLQSAAGFVRKTLGKRLRLKTIPEIEFRYDSSLDRGDRIERLLKEVRDIEGWDDPTRIRGSATEIALALTAARRILVTSHMNPDGDAIGSILAMGRLIELLGREVVMYSADPVPRNFAFLPGADRISQSFGEQPFDATVVLDCSELERVAPLPPVPARGKLVSVDHHLTTKPLGDVAWVDPGASAIGEMIFHIAEHLGHKTDLSLLTCIYTTILSDTGSFHYSNTTPSALRVAAETVAQGVEPWSIAREVYESQPLSRIVILGQVLGTLKLDPAGRIGSILVTQAMFEATGTTEEDLDGFINYPRSIRGVEVAVQYREVASDRYKVSFRSRGNVNVAEIAGLFNGGGHRNAAGCTLVGSLESVEQRIEQAIQEALAALA